MGVSAEPAFLQGERAGVCSAAHGWCCAQGEEGGILALELGGGAQGGGWPANSEHQYMWDPPGMGKEMKRALLELSNVTAA